jgi:hypothetical protein
MDDARSSENLTPGDNVEDVFLPDGNTGVDGNDSYASVLKLSISYEWFSCPISPLVMLL